MKIASLEIELLAGIARLQQDMRRAEGVVERSMGNIERQVRRVQRALGTLGLGVGAGMLIRQAQQLTDTYINLQGQLKNATRSQGEMASAMENVRRIATTSQANLEGVATAYARLSNNLRDTGISQQKVADITETVALALKVNGASVAETTSAMQQLSQAFGKGKLDGDEFRTMMEASPNVMRRVAEAIKVPFGSLKDLAQQGKITATVLADALSDTAYLESLRTQAKEMYTISGALTVLRNGIMEFVGTQAQASGVVSALTAGIMAVANNVDGIARALLFLAATAIPAAVRALWTLTTAMLAVPGMQIVKLLSVATGALMAFSGQLSLSEESTRAFKDLWGEAWGDVKRALSLVVKELSIFSVDVGKFAKDPALRSWADSVLVGFARVGDIAIFVAKSIATVATGVNTLASSAKATLAFIGRPDAASKLLAPEQSAKLEQEYQKAMDGSNNAIDRFMKSLDDLYRYQGNRLEQWALQTTGTIKVVSDEVALVDLTLPPVTPPAEIGKVNSAYQSLIATIRTKIEENQLEIAVGEKASEADKLRIKYEQQLAAGKLKLTEAQKSVIEQALKALAVSEKELEISRLLAAADKQKLDLSAQAVKSAFDEARRNRDLVTTFGMSKSALELLTVARLEDQLAQKESLNLTEEQVKAIELLIEAHKENVAALGDLESLEKQKAQWEEWKGALDEVFRQVGQSLTDAIFDGGKSGREMVKDLFKTLTLRVAIQPVMGAIQGVVTNSLGSVLGLSNPSSGSSAGGILGMASNLQTLYGAVTGGLTSSIAGAAASIGNAIGSSAISSFAAGMQGSTLAAGLAGPTTAGATGAMGLGAGFAAAVPWLAGGLAVASLLPSILGSFSGETRSGGQWGYAFDGRAWDNRDKRWVQGSQATFLQGPSGDRGNTDAAIEAAINQTVGTINGLFAGVGSQLALTAYHAGWESSGKGRGGVMAGGILSSGALFGEDGSGSVYGGKRLFEQYSSRSPSPEEAIANFETDLYQSIIQAMQAGAGEFPQIIRDMVAGVDAESLSKEAAQALVTQIQNTVAQVNALTAAFDQLPFEKLKGLSFDATAALLQLSGGVDSFVAAHEAYYQAVYSEQERLEQQQKNVEQALGGLNMTMPQTQAQYRALVESLDLNTQAGREAYTTLIALAPAWSSVTEQMTRAAQEASAAALAQSTLRSGVIDVQSLARQLADASEATFVQAMVSVFDNLAGRLSSIVDGIANERSAVQAAIRQINDLGAMTPEQILAQVAGINTTLPGSGGLLASQQALQTAMAAQASAGGSLTSAQHRAAMGQGAANSANALVAQRANELAAAQNYLADRQATANRELTGYERLKIEVFGGIFGDEAMMPDDIKQARQELPGAQAGVGRAAQLLQAAQAAAQAASVQAGAANSLLDTIRKAKQTADAQYEKASKAAQKAQLDYADAMQNFAIDAGKSVTKLSGLREETLRYYEAQAALANLMKSSADGLRKTVLDYRVSQLNPDDRFTYLQSEFEKAYSMALSTDGEALAGYADKLSSMLNPLIEQANNTFGSQASLDSFIATALARAKNIAERADALTPTDYAADSLDVLNQIDATLAALEASTRSAEQIMVDAINAGRDATVNGLRQVVNALTGKSVAAFALGGDHVGGWRLVGERGPELEVTGPSRIFNAHQTRSILSGGTSNTARLEALVERLTQKVTDQDRALQAIATSAHKLVRQGDRVEIEGQLIRTEDGTPVKIVIQSAEAPVPVEVVA